MEKLLAHWREKAGLEREGDFWTFDASILQPMHEWMRETDGNESLYTRPARVEDFLAEAASNDVNVG